MATLLKFNHGLGDAVQLTAVLEAVRRREPERQIDVFCLRGKHSALHGRCRAVYHEQEPRPAEADYHEVLDLAWHECGKVYQGLPCTKTVRCLEEVFGIVPEPAELRYRIDVSSSARERAAAWLHQACRWPSDADPEGGRFPVLLLHYEGNTATRQKNLGHRAAHRICAWAMAAGLVPVILDWDGRSPLPDGKRIHNPGVGRGDLWGGFGSGDAETLAALIELSAVCVGIDSGPLHVAAATSTPTLGIWVGHHPLRYCDLADNVLHLVPREWRKIAPGGHPHARQTFEQLYQFSEYPEHELPEVLPEVLGRLTGLHVDPLSEVLPDGRRLVRHSRPGEPELWINEQHPLEDLVIVRDIIDGDAYHLEQLEAALQESAGGEIPAEPVVVDVGAHIGTFARAWHARHPASKIVCVEACPENLPALERNVPEQTRVRHAACTYEPGELALLNAAGQHCRSTGGSIVVRRDELPENPEQQYYRDLRPLESVTLEEICADRGVDRIDVLKLDCEGSEFSILGQTTLLDRVRVIVGEFHGYARWQQLRREKFASGWKYRELSRNPSDDNGTFLLARLSTGENGPAQKNGPTVEDSPAGPASAFDGPSLSPAWRDWKLNEPGEYVPRQGRVLPGGRVEFSNDGGRTWTPESPPVRGNANSLPALPADPDLAPIVVTGPGRSGTTWMQFALSEHPHVHIHGQEPLPREVIRNVCQQFERAGRQAGRNNQAVGYRVPHYAGSDPERTRELVRKFYKAWLSGYGPPSGRWGIKAIGLAASAEYVDWWESLWPDTRWVVCLRDPFRTLESQRNTFEADRRPAEFVEQYLACARMAEDNPRAVLWQIDQVQHLEPRDRRRAFEQVLHAVGLYHDAATDAWLEQWPRVHKVKADAARTWQLTADQRRDLLERYPDLAKYTDQHPDAAA